jgi:tetratricopeptide (TPR) repeat protein
VPYGGAAGAFAVAADLELIALGGSEARLLNGTTGQPLGVELPRHTHPVSAVAFTPPNPKTRLSDGVLLGSEDGLVRFWGTTRGEQLGPPIHHGQPVTALAVHPGGQIALAGTADGCTRLWDLATGKALGALAHAGAITSLAFSPDGRTFAVATWGDVAVRLFQTATQRPLGPPLEHPAAIASLAFSPDSQTLATGCADGSARLWDVETGQRLGPPLKCKSAVCGVAFDTDGQELLTIESGRTLRRWQLPRLPASDPTLFVLWTQVLTGMRLDGQGAAHALDGAAWDAQRRQLEKLGGPPGQREQSAAQVRSWHLREADECVAARQWFAARWHLGCLLAVDPQDAAVYGRRARMSAEAGRWADAAADFKRAIELRPKGSMEFGQEGVLAYLAAGDAAGYRALCTLLVQRVGPKDDVAAEQVAGLCRLAPRALADLTPALQLAERAAHFSKFPEHQHLLGALLYRAGRYREALEKLNYAVQLRRGKDHAPDLLFLALAHHALRNEAEARRQFDKAEYLLAHAPAGPAAEGVGPLARNVRLEMQLLRREAASVLATR